MMVCINEWAYCTSIWVVPQKQELLSLSGMKAFLFASQQLSKETSIYHYMKEVIA
jgi:hypothetical protein